MPRLILSIAVALAAAATFLIRPPVAFAGTFTVHSCQTPTGTWTGMGGWTSAASAPAMDYDNGSAVACATPSASASLEFGGSSPVLSGSWLRWSLVAPENTAIVSYEVERAFRLGWPVATRVANRPYVLQIWQGDDLNAGLIDFKSPLLAGDVLSEPASDVQGRGVHWRSLHVRLSCWGLVGSLDCGPFPASVTIPRAEIGVEDVAAPVAVPTGGVLVGATPARGTAGLAFHATDQGGGVYRVTLTVDGTQVAQRVVPENDSTCADVEPANADPYEFGAPRPCPPSTDGSVQFDTATLIDGRHHVTVTVEDAAGNADVAFDGMVQTHNAPIGAAPPGLDGQARVGAQLAVAPGQWDGAPTDFDYRWLRCDAQGDACDPVAGASGPTYELTATDAYHRMRAEVTAANASGSADARSAASDVVADAAGATTPKPGGQGAPPTAPGGIQGLVNPLAQQPGHVANGASASTRARISVAIQRADGGTARRVSTRHGRRHALVGRLTDADGAGITGARVGAAWKVAGGRWVARAGVTTGSDGRFTYLLPPGPSRTVRFAYFAFSDSRAPELSNAVHVDVRAPLALDADRRRVSGARVVRLDGRVGGGVIPRGGALVTLQGFQRGWGWRTFRTVRTDRRGRWSTSYRFRLPSGRFGFRAVMPRQAGVPFAEATSRAVFVVVS